MSDMLFLTLYKDLKCIGFNQLKSLFDLGNSLGNTSILHNINKIRESLYHWSQSYIIPGTIIDWRGAARRTNFPEPFTDTNLWIDSTDIPITHTRERSAKSEFWSGKLNAPGYRFMVIQDAEGIIRRVWGGYSPKVYDSDLIKLAQYEFKQKFKGAAIISDNQFGSVSKVFQDPKFYTNVSVQKKRKRNDDDAEGVANDTRAIEQRNIKHSHVRARSERPFGNLKVKFEALSNKWSESLEQLHYLVFYAVAIHNKSH